ncbi:MAG: hypothetical protein WBM15_02180 [Chromatiaceae bacterium]
MSPVRILIFSKAPIPGRVKTRFIPTLGATGAARLASHLLRHTLTQALAAALGPMEFVRLSPLTHPDWASKRLSLGISDDSETRDSDTVTTRTTGTSRPPPQMLW